MTQKGSNELFIIMMAVVTSVVAFVLGLFIGCGRCLDSERGRAVDAGVGHYERDRVTGEKEFVYGRW